MTHWRRMTVIALVTFLFLTVALGVMLAPRWPELMSLPTSHPAREGGAGPVSSGDQSNAAQGEARSVKPEGSATDFSPGAAPAPTMASDFSKSGIARPKSYSSIDTQTLAAARVQEDVLAGKRGPASIGTPPVVAPESNDATLPRVSAVSPALPAREPSGEPLIAQPSRIDSSKPASDHAELPRGSNPAARPLRPSTAVVNLSPTPSGARGAQREALPSAQTSTARVDPERVVRVAPAATTTSAAPLPDPSRNVRVTPAPRAREPSDQVAPLMPGNAGALPTGPRRGPAAVASAQSRLADPGAASPSEAEDAAAAQLDNSWERRERWLRERLQSR